MDIGATDLRLLAAQKKKIFPETLDKLANIRKNSDS